MLEVFMGLTVFALCMIGLSVGVIFSGNGLRGSCGGNPHAHGTDGSCQVCGSKKGDVCPSDDDSGLLVLARVSNPQPHHQQRRNLTRITNITDRVS